jgi:hypothetical protein
MYAIVRAWVSPNGRCRTWAILLHGNKLAEVTTLKGARLLVQMLEGN